MRRSKLTQNALGIALLFLLFMSLSAGSVKSWSNGGYSTDPYNPKYGTHDWIAEHALEWLPYEEKAYILNNLALYFYGTELPDNSQAPDGIGDTTNHHIYYRSDGTLQEDNSAARASAEFSKALAFLKAGNFAEAAKTAGIMSHYIADMAVFGHVMGSKTDWGEEAHHSDYERYVDDRISRYSSVFDSYLSFDGKFSIVSAYDAALRLAYNTTFGVNGDFTCVWMDLNYNWSDPKFVNRVGQSLNLAVNYISDVLHTLYVEAHSTGATKIVINEVELNPAGVDEGKEWVELYNPSQNAVDLSYWTLSTTAGDTVTITIPPGTILNSGGYYLYTHSTQWLDNENECLILRDASGKEVDRTPFLSDTYNDGRSWQRYPNGKDTDSADDWIFRSSTMGLSNGGELKNPSSISIEIFPNSTMIGANVSISGAISPPRPGVVVTISFRTEGVWEATAMITTSAEGTYSYLWKPKSAGYYQFRASWEGDSAYEGAISTTASIVVTKIPTTISCNASPSEVIKGKNVTISGYISPAVSSKTVNLTYIRPDGGRLVRVTTTNPEGFYSDSYTPDANGLWSVLASWEGDAEHQGASSLPAIFNVTAQQGGCLIATATYGSALSPQVQLLRDFRDGIAMKTFAGSSFMTIFHRWYYSWSPSVADFIAVEPTAKEITRTLIEPLLHILQISTAAFSLFNFNGEVAIIFAGALASALIGIVYFAPITTILFVIMSRFKNGWQIPKSTLRLLATLWLASIILMLFGELTLSALLMMFATSTFVIFTILFVTVLVSAKVADLVAAMLGRL
ncbi:MAG: CFI-box-CTERM domain-containing protein [Candidatus Methanomethyliaceae archaeon]